MKNSNFKNPNLKNPKLKKHTGFTLIEVMVAMFILTIGMLGSTSMMLRSQLKAEETNIETTVAQRVWNITELLRASVNNINDSTNNFDALSVSTAPGSAPACISSGCSGAGLVDLTKYIIGVELDTFLPNKSPVVTVAKVSGTSAKEDIIFDIKLTWNEINKDGATYNKTYQMLFQP
ncbi:hypothetical protein MNBD_GAMMA10-261 [hydrothermal vent metagenome]|uniref:Type IV fimbrial biogenesis protein PilV n=1 Tax=hydrothermal vent metagenome TaxID=652676 RepID=A0A3B0YNE0_9ZZZZ